jgi:hypothetical protein
MSEQKKASWSPWLATIAILALILAVYIGAYISMVRVSVDLWLITTGPDVPHHYEGIGDGRFDYFQRAFFAPAHWIDRNVVRRSKWNDGSTYAPEPWP